MYRRWVCTDISCLLLLGIALWFVLIISVLSKVYWKSVSTPRDMMVMHCLMSGGVIGIFGVFWFAILRDYSKCPFFPTPVDKLLVVSVSFDLCVQLLWAGLVAAIGFEDSQRQGLEAAAVAAMMYGFTSRIVFSLFLFLFIDEQDRKLEGKLAPPRPPPDVDAVHLLHFALAKHPLYHDRVLQTVDLFLERKRGESQRARKGAEADLV